MLKSFVPVFISLLFYADAAAQPYNNAALFYKKGIDFKNKNMFPEAMTAFKKAITLNKKYDSAYVEIGQIDLRNNNPESALINFSKAIAINPEMTDAYIALGKFYRDVKPNYDSAILFYKAAIKIDSTNKESFYSLAWCYNAKTEYENAIPYGIKALEIDNSYRPAYSELGHAYRRAQKFADAIVQFKRNIAVSLVDLPMFYAGLCYTELKDKEGALEQYEALKKINERLASSLKKTIDNMK